MNLHHVFEIDGQMYVLNHNHLDLITELSSLDGPIWYITDMQEALSRVMTIDGSPKYAEFIVRKKLQESGDFTEPVTVLSHMKEKKGATADIFFTALPTRIYSFYLDQLSQCPNRIHCFPLYTILFAIIRSYKKNVALIFQHSRYAELIVGGCNHILYANRSMAFDYGEEQINDLWEAISLDIQTVSKDHRITIDTILIITWINSSPPPDNLFSDYSVSWLQPESMTVENKTIDISFHLAAKKVPIFLSISPWINQFGYFLEKLIPWVHLLIIISIITCVGGMVYLDRLIQPIKESIQATESFNATIKLETLKQVPRKQMVDTKQLIDDLTAYQSMPSFKTIVNDVSKALESTPILIDTFKLDYENNILKLELFGKISSSFHKAHDCYQQFINRMLANRYIIVKNQFSTEINSSHFTIQFNRPIL